MLACLLACLLCFLRQKDCVDLSRMTLPSLTRGDARQRKGGMNEPFPSWIAAGSLPDRCWIAAGSLLDHRMLQATVAPVSLAFRRVGDKQAFALRGLA